MIFGCILSEYKIVNDVLKKVILYLERLHSPEIKLPFVCVFYYFYFLHANKKNCFIHLKKKLHLYYFLKVCRKILSTELELLLLFGSEYIKFFLYIACISFHHGKVKKAKANCYDVTLGWGRRSLEMKNSIVTGDT